jgi:hypothetical protein
VPAYHLVDGDVAAWLLSGILACPCGSLRQPCTSGLGESSQYGVGVRIMPAYLGHVCGVE